MSYWTTPMTKLEAVNIMLSSIGESKIVSLEDAALDAEQASDLLDETSRAVQNKGWHWNRELHKLSPDTNGFIYLPNNTARVDSYGYSKSMDVVQRGQRLFNLKDNTYVFENPVNLDVIVLLPFEDLNLTTKIHVTATAAMLLQQRVLGSETVNKDLQRRAQDALYEMIRDDTQVGDYNMLRDNWSNYRIVAWRDIP